MIKPRVPARELPGIKRTDFLLTCIQVQVQRTFHLDSEDEVCLVIFSVPMYQITDINDSKQYSQLSVHNTMYGDQTFLLRALLCTQPVEVPISELICISHT